MNNRLFTFGCSFTNYFWPTWADILGREFDYFENWGANGGGQLFILNSLTESIKRNSIGKDDTVVIMWSSVMRDDRWIGEGWQLEGSLYGRLDYTQEYIDQFVDPTGYLIRDLSIISAAIKILEAVGCRWYMLSMVPFGYHENNIDIDLCKEVDMDQRVVNLYQEDLQKIRPSVYEVVFNKNWFSRPGFIDWSTWEQSYSNLAGPDWPSWKNFIVQNFNGVKKAIWNEINEHFKIDRRSIRTDTHPTPAEHLEYLQKVLPEMTISEDSIKWIEEFNQRVLSKDVPYDLESWETSRPKERF
jgi:hypothetical protein